MRLRSRCRRAATLAALLLMLYPACDSGPPSGRHAVQPVEGQVLFNGKPLAGAAVALHPVDEKKFGDAVPRPTGQTDPEGRFRLMTYSTGDGAPAGTYLVTIAGVSRPQSEPGSLTDPNRAVVKTDPLRGRFLVPKTSGLKVDIKEGKNVLPPFELK